MGRSAQTGAVCKSPKTKSNDALEAMVASGWFRVRRDGRIETCYQWRASAEYTVPWFVCDRNDGKGYRYVSFRHRRVKAHRLAYALYHNKLPGDLEINHLDGDRLNNRRSNLELCDARRQSEHAYQIGLNPRKRLQEQDVLDIRRLASDGVKYVTLGDMFGTHRVNVAAIVNRKTWKYI